MTLPVFTAEFPGNCVECGYETLGEECVTMNGEILHEDCLWLPEGWERF